MANYASPAQVGARLGFSITSGSRPNLTQMANILTDADSFINGFMNEATNITDTYGTLRVIAIALAVKMTNNVLALAEPDAYAMLEIMLTEADEKAIRKAHSVWVADSWDLGIDI